MRCRKTGAGEGSSGDALLPDALGTAGIGILLFAVVASSIAEAGLVFAATLALSWLLLPALVGWRNTLEAGCAFMVVALGTAVVTALAREGASLLVP